jgi:hypothetical protein
MVKRNKFKIVRLEIFLIHHLASDLADGKWQSVALASREHWNNEGIPREILAGLRVDIH